MPDFMLKDIEALRSFPSSAPTIDRGQYKIASTQERELESPDEQIHAEVWFQSPPLKANTIRRIDRLQLYAESHDQGFADNESGGNWTWFELAILEDEYSKAPRAKDGIELVWKSHRNRFLTDEYGWKEGQEFDEDHDLFRLLEDGNVIAVRICARFTSWKIAARSGYLVIDISNEEIDRKAVHYAKLVSEVQVIQETIHEVNVQTNAAFQPSLPDTLFRADTFSSRGERPLRVLSLDGGGVRGLASLHLLRAVMTKVNPNRKPCEVFDMIGGTSTGGLIAIMLGRLKMTIDECIEKYQQFMTTVFKSSWKGKTGDLLANGTYYDASLLEKVVKDIIREKLGNEDVKMLDESEKAKNACKVFVMAVRSDGPNNRAPLFLRSYINPQDIAALPDMKLWEAARATSAAPMYFAPMKVGDYELVDGGLGANNPLGWLWTEVLGVFGPARSTDCFLSIGTGIPASQALPQPGVTNIPSTAAALSSIATNTQIIHVLFRALINAFAPKPLGKKYWRLNIGEEIPEWTEHKPGGWFSKPKDVKHLDNYKTLGDLDDIGALKELLEMADRYIKDQSESIEQCATTLMASLGQ
ncbi:Nn.00g090910.m01.CDS01 [Neocucurbitaria sp. VM-36]